MSDPVPDLRAIDPSGAVEEAADRLSRRAFLGAGAAGAAVTLGVPAVARAKDRRAADVAILNFALTLEYLQAGFYTEAERGRALGHTGARAARILGPVERAHVAALRGALGGAAARRPFLDFRGTTEADDPFLRTAVAFEDLLAAAYKEQLARIATPEYLSAAAAIHTVEARHAAWIRYLAGAPPVLAPLDDPLPDPRVRSLVLETGFIRGWPRTTATRPPAFTG
jgi:hypothetical protein